MNSQINENIKDLKINYIVHIVLYAVIIIFNFILLAKIFWLKKLLYNLFFYGNILGILYFLIPFIPLIYILMKKLNKKNIKIFKIVTVIFCVIAIICGLFFSSILMTNAIESPEFFRECPFNLPFSYINTSFVDYFGKDNDKNDKILKKKCENRRCVLNSENEKNKYTYEYICNYDPTEEFEEVNGPFEKKVEIDGKEELISSDYEIECKKIERTDNLNFNFESEIIYKYYDTCNFFIDFYICQRFDKPNIYYLTEDYVCPQGNYLTYLIMFCILNVLINLIISFFPWRMEYNKYKNIISYYRINNTRPVSNSLNSTKNSSKIQKRKQEEEIFKKEPTEIIVVCNQKLNHLNQINNNIFEDDINIHNNVIHISRVNNIKNCNSDKKESKSNLIKIDTINIQNARKEINGKNLEEENINISNEPKCTTERVILKDNKNEENRD